MPSNFLYLKIEGMKIDSKKRQQKKCPDNYETVLISQLLIRKFCVFYNQKAQKLEIIWKSLSFKTRLAVGSRHALHALKTG